MLDGNSSSEQSLAPGNFRHDPMLPSIRFSNTPIDTTDEIAALEATYQQTSFDVSEEMEMFASELDRFNAELRKGSPAEKRANIFKLLDSYYTYSRRRADKLRNRQSHARSARGGSWQPAGSTEMDVDEADDGSTVDGSDELLRVEEEAQTWDLLRRILPLRYRDTTRPKPRANAPANSRSQAWNEFLLSDSSAREKKVILEWLQSSASRGPPIDEIVRDLQRNAERGDILAHGWLHTRSKIKMQKSVNGYQGVIDPDDPALIDSHLSSNTLITQLDPDAMTRQGRKLEPEDEFFERAIWLGCFEMLRRGSSMSEIRDWCSERTELWRAATISPLPLSSPEDEEQANFNPNALILWRRMCFATARDGGTSDYDRAVYGLLAGDLPSVEKVCKSWGDFLFAHYNSILRSQFDSFLVRRSGEKATAITQKFPSFSAGSHGSDPVGLGRRLIANLETDPRTATEALSVMKALQGAVIAGNLDQHLFQQGVVLTKDANRSHQSRLIPDMGGKLPDSLSLDKFFELSNHDYLRIATHILIIVSALDELSGASKEGGPMDVRHQIQEHIVVAYISFLRLANLPEMVPLYASKLHGPRVYQILSRNLNDITDPNARLHQLNLIRKLGLDVDQFVRIQPEIYLADADVDNAKFEVKEKLRILHPDEPKLILKYGRVLKPDFFGEDAEHIDNEDDLIIRAMEWLMLTPGQFMETCEYAIRIYKYFLSKCSMPSILTSVFTDSARTCAPACRTPVFRPCFLHGGHSRQGGNRNKRHGRGPEPGVA